MLKIKRLSNAAKMPERAFENDAGIDVFAAEKCVLWPSERATIGIGWAMSVPNGYEIQVRSRSGLALHQGLIILNSPGTIDAGYRGEVRVIFINMGKEKIIIDIGMKIAQLVINKIELWLPQEVADLEESKRDVGSFGSTNKE